MQRAKKEKKKKRERERERGIIELVCYFFAALIILWRKEQCGFIILLFLVCYWLPLGEKWVDLLFLNTTFS